jgi:serine/threonine protein kinase
VIAHLRRGNDLDAYDAWSDERYCRCIGKTPRPDRARRPRIRRHVHAEGRLLLGLSHPGLVRAYDLVRSRPGQPPVLVLETLTGATLSYLLHHGRRRLSTPDLAHLGRQLCSAIRYLHGRGYLHLDLKPSNIIAEAGRAKVIDLGHARRPGPCPAGLGTLAFMAPEQAVDGDVGPAADVWGLGLVLFEAATGVQPFDRPEDDTARDEPEDECRQLTVSAPPVRSLRRLPGALATAIDGCLARAPADRPTLAELWAACTTVTGAELPTVRAAG